MTNADLRNDELFQRQVQRLLQAIAVQEPSALERFGTVIADPSSAALTHAQLVIASEHGFDDWSALCTAVDTLGQLVEKDTLRFSRLLPASLERTWRAISEADELSQWFMKTELELRIGGRFSFEHGWEGSVGAVVPQSSITFRADQGGVMSFEIEAHDQGTRFTLTDRMAPGIAVDAPSDEDALLWNQPGGPGTHWTGVVAGFHGFVDSLEAHLHEVNGLGGLSEQQLLLLYNTVLTEFHGAEGGRRNS